MKKVLFAMAIAGMFGFAACNNTKNAEEPATDSMVNVENVAAECEMADSLTVETPAEECAEAAAETVAE